MWEFHTIPLEGEYGNETWESDAWKKYGAANVWATMTADEELGNEVGCCGTRLSRKT